MYSSGYSQVSKSSPPAQKKTQYRSKSKSCGYYMRIVFFFSSLIQSLIIVSLVLFLVYGKTQDSASTSRVQDLEESFSRLSIENVALRHQRKNLTNLLNATLTEKARNDWDLARLRFIANISMNFINDLDKKLQHCNHRLSFCESSTSTARCPSTFQLPNSCNCGLMAEQLRARLELVESNFTQTAQRMRMELDQTAKERDSINLEVIRLRRDKSTHEKEVEFFRQKCKDDFSKSLSGISNVSKAFLEKINSLFPSHIPFQLTCPKQREHLEQIRTNCSSLSMEVEDKLQSYLNVVGGQVSGIQAENSRMKAENWRLSEDYRWCSMNRTGLILQHRQNLDKFQRKHDEDKEKLLMDKMRLNGEIEVLNNDVKYKSKSIDHLLEQLKQLNMSCISKTGFSGFPGGATGSQSQLGWGLGSSSGRAASGGSSGSFGSPFNKPGSTGLGSSFGSAFNKPGSTGLGSSFGSAFNKPGSTGTGSSSSSVSSTGLGSAFGSAFNKPGSTGTGSSSSSVSSTGLGSSFGSAFNKPGSTGTGSSSSSVSSTGLGSSFGSAFNKPGSTGTGSSTSSVSSTGSGSSFGSAFNKPGSTGTGSSSSSVSSTGLGSSFGSAFNKPGSTGTGSSTSSVSSTGSGSSFGSAFNKPGSTGTGSSTGSGLNKPGSTGTGSSTGSGLNKPGSTGTGSSTGSGLNKPGSTGTGSSTGSGVNKPGSIGGFFSSFGSTGSDPKLSSSGTGSNKPALSGKTSTFGTSSASSGIGSNKPTSSVKSSSGLGSSSGSTGSTGSTNKSGSTNSGFSWLGFGSSNSGQSKTGSGTGRGPSTGNSGGIGSPFDAGRTSGLGGGGSISVAQHIRDLQRIINPSGPEEKQDLSRMLG